MEPTAQNSTDHENDSFSKKSSKYEAESFGSKNSSQLNLSPDQIPESNTVMEVTEAEVISPKNSQSNINIDENQVLGLEKNEVAGKSVKKHAWITQRFPIFLTFNSRERPRQPLAGNTRQNQSNRQNIPTPPNYYPSRQQNRVVVRSEQPNTAHSDQPIYFNRYHTPLSNELNFTHTFINPAFWTPYPSSIPPNTPPHLAQLVDLDALFVIKNFEIIEFITGIQTPNIYLIQNKHGECLYYAYEVFDLLMGCCCENKRGFQLIIKDIYHNEVIFMNKLCGCKLPCFFCCYPMMEVYAPPSVPIGAIIRVCESLRDDFVILDANENKMFIIRGNISGNFCGGYSDLEYSIHALDPNKTIVGYIKREFGNFRTYFFNSGVRGISFPSNLDVRIKSVFLGALFLIEIMYFN